MKARMWKTYTAALLAAALFLSPAWAGKKDSSLNFAWQKELETLDRYYNTAREGMIVSRQIFDDLLYRDPVTYEYKPLLAKSFKWIDNLTMEFELRRGITFHNGEAFDADDVVYTINFVSNPDNKVLVQRNVNWIKNAEKLGPFKVKLHLKKPFPAALEYLAGNVPIYPNEYYAKVESKAFGMKPVGTGPYKVVEVVQGKKIVFEKNADYFTDSPKGQPSIQRIVQRTIPEMTTMVAELMTGGLDWIYMVPKDQAERLERVPSLTTVRAETMRIGFGVKLRWLPISGSDSRRHFILPAIALGYYATPAFMRLTRSGLLDVLSADYICTAKAKGLRTGTIIFKHALRNAIIPVISLAAVQFGFMLGGSLVIETVFAINGVVYLGYESISRADLPMVQAIVLMVSMFYVVLTFLADVLNAYLNPQMRVR